MSDADARAARRAKILARSGDRMALLQGRVSSLPPPSETAAAPAADENILNAAADEVMGSVQSSKPDAPAATSSSVEAASTQVTEKSAESVQKQETAGTTDLKENGVKHRAADAPVPAPAKPAAPAPKPAPVPASKPAASSKPAQPPSATVSAAPPFVPAAQANTGSFSELAKRKRTAARVKSVGGVLQALIPLILGGYFATSWSACGGFDDFRMSRALRSFQGGIGRVHDSDGMMDATDVSRKLAEDRLRARLGDEVVVGDEFDSVFTVASDGVITPSAAESGEFPAADSASSAAQAVASDVAAADLQDKVTSTVTMADAVPVSVFTVAFNDGFGAAAAHIKDRITDTIGGAPQWAAPACLLGRGNIPFLPLPIVLLCLATLRWLMGSLVDGLAGLVGPRTPPAPKAAPNPLAGTPLAGLAGLAGEDGAANPLAAMLSGATGEGGAGGGSSMIGKALKYGPKLMAAFRFINGSVSDMAIFLFAYGLTANAMA